MSVLRGENTIFSRKDVRFYTIRQDVTGAVHAKWCLRPVCLDGLEVSSSGRAELAKSKDSG